MPSLLEDWHDAKVLNFFLEVLRKKASSYATWLIEAGANPKDVQGQMRHSRIATTMDIYAQFVPESQQRAISRMSAMVQQRLAAKRASEAKAAQTMHGSQLIQ